ncbi:MAG TPA: hypothetical protein VIY56_09585 [Vicinamibacterales bacterium]
MSVATAGAQSLGDVARREAERRKTVKVPGKTYTNDQLKADGRDVASVPTPGPDAAQASPAPATGAPTPTPSMGSPTPSRTGTGSSAATEEASWRGRIQATREAKSRSQIFADALQSRINGLSADFTARDDPAQRAVVANERQKSLDELERVKKELQQHDKALADIQEEGRKAGVPAAWLR